MRLTASRKALAEAMAVVSRALPSRSLKPILDGVLARATDKLTLFATDLEIAVQVELAAQIEEPGEAIFPGGQFSRLLADADAEELLIEASAEDVRVSTPSAEFHLPAMDPKEFPQWPEFPTDKRHEIAAGELYGLIRRTLFAVAKPKDETRRYALTGVGWRCGEGFLRLQGTDGLRASVDERPCTALNGHSPDPVPVVPQKAMQALALMTQGADPAEVVGIHFRSNDALFRCGAASLYTRLVQGRFLDALGQIPKGKATTAAIGAGALAQILRQARVTTSDASFGVLMTLTKDRVRLEGNGRGASKVDAACAWNGKEITLALDPGRLAEFLAVLNPAAEIRMDVIGAEEMVACRIGETHRCLFTTLALPKT